jgi:hypothetical protein
VIVARVAKGREKDQRSYEEETDVDLQPEVDVDAAAFTFGRDKVDGDERGNPDNADNDSSYCDSAA